MEGLVMEIKEKTVGSISEGFFAIVDLFGHTTLAGHVSETTIGGCPFVRVDIPGIEGESQPVTKLYGNGAIYGMTLVSEEVVLAYVKRYKPAPLNVYMPEIKQVENKKVSEDPTGPYYDQDDE
jgi:hypothetical protein